MKTKKFPTRFLPSSTGILHKGRHLDHVSIYALPPQFKNQPSELIHTGMFFHCSIKTNKKNHIKRSNDTLTEAPTKALLVASAEIIRKIVHKI